MAGASLDAQANPVLAELQAKNEALQQQLLANQKSVEAMNTKLDEVASAAAAASTALATGYFEASGEFSAFTSILDGAGQGADTQVQVTVAGGGLVASQDPSAGACRKSPSAILVEVCYFLPDAAPSADDVNIPYGIEAGQTGN